MLLRGWVGWLRSLGGRGGRGDGYDIEMGCLWVVPD